MELRRAISIIIAAVVAALVIWAGRSCAENIQKKNREKMLEDYTYNVEHATGGSDFNVDYVDGVAGEEFTTAATTAENVQTVTNLFGEVVGTVTVTTTTPPETKPTTTTTVSKSILESYNEQRQTAVNSGQGSILERPQTETTAVITQPTGIVIDLG